VTPDMFPEVVPTEDPNRRYTPRAFMEWIREKAGVEAFDLDPAADDESHWAPRWYSVAPMPGSAGVDGLAQSWLPPRAWFDQWPERSLWRVFVNPPFDDLGPWTARAWEHCQRASLSDDLALRIAFVLPGNRHEQPFWQEHIEPFRDGRATRFGYRLELHFPAGRQAYAKPGSNGVAVGSADFPSALLVWRRA
jgi:hypothetical protein